MADEMTGILMRCCAWVLALTPCSWVGLAMVTIPENRFACLGLVLSLVLPYYLLLWTIIDSFEDWHMIKLPPLLWNIFTYFEGATVPLPLLLCCLFGLGSLASWAVIVHEDQVSVRNPKDWIGLALLCLHHRLDVSFAGAVLGSMFAICIQLVIVKFDTRQEIWTCGVFDLCFGYNQGFCAYSFTMTLFGWIGGLVAPFIFMISQRGEIPKDIAQAREWLLPKLYGTDRLFFRNRQAYTLETHAFTIPADAFPSTAPRAVGSVVLEVRNLIKPRRRQVDTLVSLLRLRFPTLPVEEVSGERSFARIRVSLDTEAVAVAAIKLIAQESGKKIDVREVPGTRVFNSPRE